MTMRIWTPLLLAVCLLQSGASLPAQTASPTPVLALKTDQIGSTLSAMVSDGRAAGVSVLVWKDGREAYFGSAGYADRETKRPMTRDAIAQIYSMTKPVTGVALMQLWEQGKFGLDDPLSRYLPAFESMQVYTGKDAGGQPIYRAAARPITVRDIMRHTAGFAYGAGDTPAHDAYVKAGPLALDHDLPEMGKRLAKVPLLFDPGTRWSYSIAVDVQALLVETLSGQPFADYVRQHVLEPLRMRETAWRQPDERLPRLAVMYRVKDGALTRDTDEAARDLNFRDHRLTGGGFGLASTIDDYMRLARMLLNEGELDGVRVLKPSTVKLMSTDHLDARITERNFLPGKGSVGFGFDFAVRVSQPQKPQENRGAVGEFFWDGAASTLFWVDPANHLAAVFFTQKMPFDGTLHHDIRQAIYGADYLGPPGDLGQQSSSSSTPVAPAPQAGGGRAAAPLLVPNPHYASIHMMVDVNAPVDRVWARVGKYCDIGEWGGFGGCTIVSGTDGEVGVVRSIGSEIMVAKTQYSYTYAQPVRTSGFYNMYHGTLEARALTPTTTQLHYTLFFDNSNLADDAARETDITNRRTRFTGMLQNMKILAEGGTLPAPARGRGLP